MRLSCNPRGMWIIFFYQLFFNVRGVGYGHGNVRFINFFLVTLKHGGVLRLSTYGVLELDDTLWTVRIRNKKSLTEKSRLFGLETRNW